MKLVLAIAKGLLMFLILLPFEFAVTWTSMLWLGVAHSFDARVPALGYWACFFLLWVFTNVVTLALVAKDMRNALNEQ